MHKIIQTMAYYYKQITNDKYLLDACSSYISTYEYHFFSTLFIYLFSFFKLQLEIIFSLYNLIISI